MTNQKDRIHKERDCPPLGNVSKNNQGKVAFPFADFTPDPELGDLGWERRFLADTSRTDEMTAIYEEQGFEDSSRICKTRRIQCHLQRLWFVGLKNLCDYLHKEAFFLNTKAI